MVKNSELPLRQLELEAAVLNGDTAKFGELYLLYYAPPILSLYARMRIPKEDARDLVSDIYRIAFKELEKGEFRKEGSLFTWIYGIAVKKGLKYLKKVGRFVSMDLNGIIPNGSEAPSPDATMRGKRLWSIVERILPEKYFKVLILRTLGYADEQIARELGVSRKTVGEYYYRSVARINRYIKEHKIVI